MREISEELASHELAHCVVNSYTSISLVTLDTNDGAATTWMRGKQQPFHSLISVLAGPFTEIIMQRGNVRDVCDVDLDHFTRIVLNTPSETQYEDAARARRLTFELGQSVLQTAAETAIRVALIAATMRTHNPKGLAAFRSRLIACSEDEGVVVGLQTLNDLADGKVPAFEVLNLHEFLKDDPEGDEALKIESYAIIAEMARKGLIVDGKVTPLGLLSLGD